MNIILVLILASLGIATLFLAAFIWAVKSGQYEDTVTPSLRMLLDDPPPPPRETTHSPEHKP
jgi:cbb3-type cytochrome oxidase maturation protein